MAGPGTLTRALQELKAEVPRNIRQVWSSMTLDQTAIVGMFWKDQFVNVKEYGPHRIYTGEALADFGKDSPGFKRWRGHLRWAWARNPRILVIEAERGAPSNRKFVARKDCVMKLTALDPETGAFVAREETIPVEDLNASNDK